MRKLVLFTFALFPLLLAAQPTTPQQQLESAIRAYNVLQAYIEPLDYARLTADQAARITGDVRNGVALTDELARTQTGDLLALARYFRANFRVEEARLALAQNRAADAVAALEAVRTDVESVGEPFFPRTYELEGKSYTVRWDTYAPQRAEYYRLSAQAYLTQKNYARALEESDRALRHAYVRPRTRTAVTDYYVQSKTGLNQLDVERLDYALEGLRSFDRLSPAEQREFVNEKSNLLQTLYRTIDDAIRAQHQPYPHPGQYYGEAAVALAQYESTRDEAVAAYSEALKREYGHVAFSDGAYTLAARHYQTPWSAARPGRDAELRALALAALAHQRTLTKVDDCEALRRLSERYEKFAETQVANELRANADACQAVRTRQQDAKEREAHFYAGIYLVPFLAFRNVYRDYGVAVNFGGRRIIAELSYQRINNNQERYTDLLFRGIRTRSIGEHYWSGYYTHVALKFNNLKQSKKKTKGYIGPLLSYNERNFSTIPARVTDAQGVETAADFNPTMKQYALMANSGLLILNGFAFDIFWSIGASYNEFDGGNELYWNRPEYVINDALLEERREDFIGLIGRFGITVGFGR
jgi:hypothetical protein